MKKLMSRFERHLVVERNVSEHTRRAYLRDLEGFRAFLDENLPGRGSDEELLRRVDHLMLRRYMAQLHRTNRKTTIGRKLAAIRTFFAGWIISCCGAIWPSFMGRIARAPSAASWPP